MLTVLLLCNTSLSAQNPNYNDHRNHKVDSLEQVLATNPPTGEDLLFLYIDLEQGYREINSNKVIEYAQKAIPIAKELDYLNREANLYRNIAVAYYKKSLYDSAMVYFDKALEVGERMKNNKKYTEEAVDDRHSLIYGSIANLYNIQGKYHEAIEYYTKALKIFEKHGWKESLAIAYSNISQMYMSMENYEQAEISSTKLYAIGQEIRDSLIIMYADEGLSSLYLAQKNYAKALEHAEAARRYIFSHPEEGESSKAFVFNLFAQIYLDGYNDIGKSENYVRQALQRADSIEMESREKAVSLCLLSSIHLKRSEWRKAEQTALEALATDDSEPGNTLSLYENLAKAYAKLGDSGKAWEYFDKHNALQASWSNKHYQSAIREMETKYETEKKEAKIAALEGEKRR
jgi:tetratricopeptide (TPR) repeat protein